MFLPSISMLQVAKKRIAAGQGRVGQGGGP